MTEPFALHRRTPAGRLRYIVDKLNQVRGEDVEAQTILVAARHLLTELAADLDTADEPAEELPPDGEMTTEQAERLDAETVMSGVDTEGCDCGHDGLGLRWHARDCAWRKEQP